MKSDYMPKIPEHAKMTVFHAQTARVCPGCHDDGGPCAVCKPELENRRVSVLQDWVMELPLREQGTLLTAVRGCDLTPKYPLDSLERRLVGFVRWCFMVPADPREVDKEPGCFFISAAPDLNEVKPSALGHYPWHWLSHLMHALEVIGYRHSNELVAHQAMQIYQRLVHSFHLNHETFPQFAARLSEDRIESGEVVS